VSNSVILYKFIGFVTFNIAVHELGLIFVYSFLLHRRPYIGPILVSMVGLPRATVRMPTLKPKNPKT